MTEADARDRERIAAYQSAIRLLRSTEPITEQDRLLLIEVLSAQAARLEGYRVQVEERYGAVSNWQNEAETNRQAWLKEQARAEAAERELDAARAKEHDHEQCIAEMTAAFERSLDQVLERAEAAEKKVQELQKEVSRERDAALWANSRARWRT